MFSFYLLGVGRIGSHPSSLLNHFSACQTQLLKSSAPAHGEARAWPPPVAPLCAPPPITGSVSEPVGTGWVGRAHGTQFHPAENPLTCPRCVRLELRQVRCHPCLQVSTPLSGCPAGLQTRRVAQQQRFQSAGRRKSRLKCLAWRVFLHRSLFPFSFHLFSVFYFFFQFAFSP